jgi:hypothetical protein
MQRRVSVASSNVVVLLCRRQEASRLSSAGTSAAA